MNHDATTLWESCLSYLSERVNERSFNTWLKPTRLLAIEGNRVMLAVPNKFVAEWLEQHYLPVMNEALEKITGERLTLSFATSGEDFPACSMKSIGE